MKYISLLFFITAVPFSLYSDEKDNQDSYIQRNYGLENQIHPTDDFSATNPYQLPVSAFEPIYTPQEIARERIHNQCESLSHQERFLLPTYSARELSAIACSAWSANDFAHAAAYAAYQSMQQGK